MIQRIQSLYLLVATALMASTLFLPIANVVTINGDTLTLTAFSWFGGGIGYAWVFALLFCVATLVPFLTIFLFKNRKRQIGLCAAEGVLQLGSVLVIALFHWMIIPDIFPENAILGKSFGWAAIMPIIALIPTYFAGRAIFKDEVLVRSLDRIR